jgi:hypothetical protein
LITNDIIMKARWKKIFEGNKKYNRMTDSAVVEVVN